MNEIELNFCSLSPRSPRDMSFRILLGWFGGAMMMLLSTTSAQGQCCSSGTSVTFTCYPQAVPETASVTATVDGVVVGTGQVIALGVGWHTLHYSGVHNAWGDTTGIRIEHTGCGDSRCVIYQDDVSGDWRLGSGTGVSLAHGVSSTDYYGGPPEGPVDPHYVEEERRFYVIDPNALADSSPGDEGGDAAPDDSGGSDGGSGFDPSEGGGSSPPSSTQSSSTFSLGSFPDGQSRGWLQFTGDLAATEPVSLASITAFNLPNDTGSATEYYMSGDQVLQALANDVLTNIVEAGAGVIQLQYYRADQLVCEYGIPHRETTADPFTIIAGEQPYKVIEIRHLDPAMDSSVTTESIRYQTTMGGEVIRESTFSAVAGSGGSERRLVSGSRVFVRTEAQVAPVENRPRRMVVDVEKAIQADSTEVAVRTVTRIYETFSWGREEMAEETRQAGAVTETDSYAYYDATVAPGTDPPPGYGRLKSVVRADGTWEMFEYTADGSEWRFSGLLNGQPPASPAEIPRAAYGSGADCRTVRLGPPLPRSGAPVVEEEFISGVRVRHVDRTEGDAAHPSQGVMCFKSVARTTVRGLEGSPLEEQIWRENVPNSGSFAAHPGDILYSIGPDNVHREFTGSSQDSVRSETVIGTGWQKVVGKSYRTTHYKGFFWGEVDGKTYDGEYSDNQVEVYMGYETETGDIWASTSYQGSETLNDDAGRPVNVRAYSGWYDDPTATNSVAEYVYAGPVGQQTVTITTTSADGTQTVTTQNDRGEMTASVLTGFAESAAGPAQPAVHTSITTSLDAANGIETRATTVTAGTGDALRTYSTSESVDALGHPVSSVDATGRMTTFRRVLSSGSTGIVEIELQPGDTDADGQRGRVTEYYREGRLKSITGTRVIAEHYNYYTEQGGSGEVEEVHYGTADSPRFKRTCRNALGMVLWEETPHPLGTGAGTIRTTYSYDSAGRLAGIERPSLAKETVEYDELSREAARWLDVDQSGTKSVAGADPLTETDSYYEEDSDQQIWHVTQQRRYDKDGTQHFLETITKRKQNTGRNSEVVTISPDGSKVVETIVIDFENRQRTVTRKTYRPGDTDAEAITTTQVWANGLMVSESIPGEEEPMRFEYDALRRLVKTIDPRVATGRRQFKGDGRLEWEETAAGERTAYTYYGHGAQQGWLFQTTDQGGATHVWAYDLMGRIIQEAGTATYPIQYSYDPAYGELTGLSVGGSFTAWEYDEGSGKLLAKAIDGSRTTYAYIHADDRVSSRSWQRVVGGGSQETVKTNYDYDKTGRLKSLTYNDGTPTVLIQYDRAGRPVWVVDGSGVRSIDYDRPDGAASVEEHLSSSVGLLTGLIVERVPADPEAEAPVDEAVVLKKRTGESSSVVLSAARYGRDATRGAMSGVAFESGTLSGSATHDWGTSARGLPGRMTYAGAAGLELSRGEELGAGLKRQTVKLLRGGAAGPVLSSTVMEGPYRPTAQSVWTTTSVRDGVSWTYRFNNRKELSLAAASFNHRTQPDDQGQTAAGEPATVGYGIYYNYDDAGNRVQLEQYAGRLDQAPNIRTYARNSMNQYTEIGRQHGEPKILLGTAAEHAFVSAWLSSSAGNPVDLAVYRAQRPQDEAGQLGFIAAVGTGAASPLWRELHVTAEHRGPNPPAGGTMSHRTGQLYFPPMIESLAYDLDGNLTDDARWHYTWDAENRLKGMETQAGAVAAGVPQQRLSFTYDSQHRRVRKVVESWNATTQNWSVTTDRRFVYDGWNLIAELERGATGTVALKRTYAWGLDLSGTTTGAGGVGGLVSVTEYDAAGNAVRMLAPAYDTNGNVMAYADIATGSLTHRFEYDAFGIALTVSYSDNTEAPPFRFSTKYLDAETGQYYYGYRYYSPEQGRWLSRDPMFDVVQQMPERTDMNRNLYRFVSNDPIGNFDLLGLKCTCGPDITQSLRDTMTAVDNAWEKLDSATRKSVCETFVGTGSWDITDLKHGRYSRACGERDKSNAKACQQTVTVNGECWYRGSVNYILYGRVMRHCQNSAIYRSLTVWWYKSGSGNYDASQEWAKIGQNSIGSYFTAPAKGDRQGCNACISKHSGVLHGFAGTGFPKLTW